MEDNTIKKIRRVLTYKGREDLADLLRHSTSVLDESSTFGSRWYSRLSSFVIKSHPQTQEKIDKLSEEDIQEILDTFSLKNKNQLPLILKTDPMGRYLGLCTGDVVKISRNSPSSGEYYVYRCCL